VQGRATQVTADDLPEFVILIFAVIVGLAAGLVRAALAGRRYRPVHLAHFWIVISVFIPQIIAFYLPFTREIIPLELAEICLSVSLVGLLLFVWLNRKYVELWVVGIGLVANLFVIAANGGLMPITPSSVLAIYPWINLDQALLGSRLGWSKNIILNTANTRFAFLSDCVLLPRWVPWKFAFSPGDVLIAVGVFWLLWNCANERESD
jgi:hypothetical protein